jgi:outer membrane protein assembly factor BamB
MFHLFRTILVLGWLAIVMQAAPAFAQQDNPVYVDDSKRAWEQFQRAEEQRRDNLGEAVRIYQALLDEFGRSLIPALATSRNHFRTVRARVLDALRSDDELLSRYREMNSAEAQRLLDMNALPAVAARFPLTDAGLKAMVGLAQDHLENGRFEMARLWLDEAAQHPALDVDTEQSVIIMSTMAAQYLHDAAALERLADHVQETPRLARIVQPIMERIAALNVEPAMPDGITSFERTEADDLTDLVAQAIWEVPLVDSLLRRQTTTLTSGFEPEPQYTERWLDADLLTIAATATDDLVYINEGHRIHAFNRLTGHWQWSYDDRHRRSSMLTYENELTLDLNAITVSEGALVTLTGHAYSQKRSGQGAVVCIDPETGEGRWRVVLAEAGLPGSEERDELFPHGIPVIHEGSVYMLARKVSKQLLTSTYVVALDLANGNVQWVQHVCSSGALRRVGRIMSSLVVRDGDIYVATAVGAIARLDAGTGSVRWLQRFSVPITGLATTQVHRPWEISVPVVTDKTVIALQPDQTMVVVLDRETGDVLTTHPCRAAERWNSPTYLLSDGEYLYAIGSDIRAFHLELLDTLAWQYPPPMQETAPNQSVMRPSLNLRGRVQLVDEALIVPSLESLLILDRETGRTQHALDMPGVGNPLASDSQLLLVDGQRLRSFMPFARAESMLRQRLAERPTDAEPALSLLRLGSRVKNIALVLEAAAIVFDTLDTSVDEDAERSRRLLFEDLIQDDTIALIDDPQTGEKYFELMGALALSPEDRVRHLLLRSDWRASFDPRASIAGYHDLLSNDALAGVLVTEDDVRRTARSLVTDRLFVMREQEGIDFFRDVDAAAQGETDAAVMAITPDVAGLLAVVRHAPTSPAAIDAALLAAPMLVDASRSGDAIGVLESLDHPKRRAEDRARLFGAAAYCADEFGWTRTATGLLASARTSLGTDRLPTPEGVREIDAWITALPRQALTGVRASAGEVGETAQVIPGALVPWHALSDGAASGPRDAALLLNDDGDLQLIRSPSLKPAWTTSTEANRLEIIRWTDESILLWNGMDTADPFAMYVDTATGQVRWISAPLEELTGEQIAAIGRQKPLRRTLPNGMDVDLRETLPIVVDETLVLVRRDGRMIGVDLADGKTVLWTINQGLEEVHFVSVVDGAVVLAGVSRRLPSDPDAYPAVAVMWSHQAGEIATVLRPYDDAPIIWMQATGHGRIAIGTEMGIELLEPRSCTWAWTNLSYAGRSTLRAWCTSDHLLVEDRTNAVRSFALADGSVAGTFDVSSRGEWDPLNLQEMIVDGDRLFAVYRDRFLRYTPAGEIEGADMVNTDRKYMWGFPAKNRVVVVSEHRREQQPLPDRSGRRTVRVYQVFQFSPNGKLEGRMVGLDPILERLERASLIDGWLLLSMSNKTITLPMPATSP